MPKVKDSNDVRKRNLLRGEITESKSTDEKITCLRCDHRINGDRLSVGRRTKNRPTEVVVQPGRAVGCS